MILENRKYDSTFSQYCHILHHFSSKKYQAEVKAFKLIVMLRKGMCLLTLRGHSMGSPLLNTFFQLTFPLMEKNLQFWRSNPWINRILEITLALRPIVLVLPHFWRNYLLKVWTMKWILYWNVSFLANKISCCPKTGVVVK